MAYLYVYSSRVYNRKNFLSYWHGIGMYTHSSIMLCCTICAWSLLCASPPLRLSALKPLHTSLLIQTQRVGNSHFIQGLRNVIFELIGTRCIYSYGKLYPHG